VKTKNTKNVGVVMFDEPAIIGNRTTCSIPGGPLILEGYVYVNFRINGKLFLCLEKTENLEAA